MRNNRIAALTVAAAIAVGTATAVAGPVSAEPDTVAGCPEGLETVATADIGGINEEPARVGGIALCKNAEGLYAAYLQTDPGLVAADSVGVAISDVGFHDDVTEPQPLTYKSLEGLQGTTEVVSLQSDFVTLTTGQEIEVTGLLTSAPATADAPHDYRTGLITDFLVP